MIKKLGINEVPQDVLKELQAFVPNQHKEVIAIGNNFYAVTPTSAVKLLEVISELFEILDELRIKKIERIKAELTEEQLKDFNPALVMTTINDIITDKTAVEKTKALLPKLLDGVDEEDLQAITIGQLLNAFDKIIEVNINTLPPSYKKTLQDMNIVKDEQNEVDASKNP